MDLSLDHSLFFILEEDVSSSKRVEALAENQGKERISLHDQNGCIAGFWLDWRCTMMQLKLALDMYLGFVCMSLA